MINCAGADARGSFRRRDRDFRRRRCGHAVGGIGGRQYPVEAVATMNRIAEEVEGDPPYRNIIAAQRAEPEPTGADAIADAARQIADTLDLSAIICWTSSGSTGSARGARAAAAADRCDLAQHLDRAAACRWSGACIAWSPKMRTTRTTWSTAPAASRSRKASPKPASASSSSPAFRSARRARPTWCASPLSDREISLRRRSPIFQSIDGRNRFGVG